MARELGIGANLLTRWRREAENAGSQSFVSTGTPCDEELAALKRELAGVKKERDFLRGNVLCKGVVLRYQAIQRCRNEFPVRLICRCLKVSPSGFYD